MEKSADAFRTISEVSDMLGTPAHVLRFWESRFPQIKPVKRAGGRRYYRPSDVALLTGIKRLLHDEGLTIRGVQKVLREHGIRHVASLTLAPGAAIPTPDQADRIDAALPEPAAPAGPPHAEKRPQAPRKPVTAAPKPQPQQLAEPLPLWAAAVQRFGQRVEHPTPSRVPSQPQVAVVEPTGETVEALVWLPSLLRTMTPMQVALHRARLADAHIRLLALRNRVVDAARQPAP
jgi:DNA-binding transcriptional MerR regulator